MISEIHAKSILRKQKKIDSWFLSSYGMNLYRGCSHQCAYCDGRAEKYQVAGDFGTDIEVKVNSMEVLKRELDPKRKRTPWKSGFMLIGGGVCDSYQPIEKRYQLTRQALLLLQEHPFPVHLLTKSCLIERDMDLIHALHEKQRAVVSMSFSSVDDAISGVFEPQAYRPSQRLQTLARFKKRGIPIAMFLMPLIPFITDLPEKIDAAVRAAREIGVDFMVISGMTLKPGRQADHFFNVLDGFQPALQLEYGIIYKDHPYGQSTPDYNANLHEVILEITRSHHMPVRMPLFLWSDLVTENERVVILLEHIDYFLKMRGQRSVFGYAAWNLAQVTQPLSSLRARLEQVKGVGKNVADIVREILDNGTCRFYEWLLSGKKMDHAIKLGQNNGHFN